MFKKLISKLYLRYCEPDLVRMTRIQLMGVQEEAKLTKLSQTEIREFITESQTILASEVFKVALNNVKVRLRDYIQNEAPTFKSLLFARYTINGVGLIEEELIKYSNSELDIEGDFDEHAGI